MPLKWSPPPSWKVIRTVDAHAAGEPLRVIIEGLPKIPGTTILEKRKWVKENIDHLRKALMWEPRGHADMYGAIITDPASPDSDLGVLFLHNEGYSTMCGHGIIALTTAVLETGMFPIKEPETILKIDTPAGTVISHARIKDKRVKSVYFHNVPAFVLALDEEVDVPGIGKIKYDIAFGGAFYAFVKAQDAGVKCGPEFYRQLIERGMAIKRAVMEKKAIVHPFDSDLSFLYGTIFICPPQEKTSHSRNVCIFADGEVDRSPTGTGVSARLALHYVRGEIKIGEQIIIESIIGTKFAGRVVDRVKFGPYDAIIPEVEGSAYITGKHEFILDPEDPLKYGFFLR